MPVGFGQVRKPTQLPVLTMVTGYSRWLSGQLIPTRSAADLFTGWWQVSEQFSVNAGVFNLTDKEYWQWGDVQGLDTNSVALGRYTQPGRHAAVNLIWEI